VGGRVGIGVGVEGLGGGRVCVCACWGVAAFVTRAPPHPSPSSTPLPSTPPSQPPPPQHDIVPRTSVHSLSELQRELESHRDAFFAHNKVAGFLRDSGAIGVTKTVTKALFNAAMAGGAARMAARGPLGAVLMTAGAVSRQGLGLGGWGWGWGWG